MAVSDEQHRADAIMAWAHAQIATAEVNAQHEGEVITGVALAVCYGSNVTVGFKGENKSLIMRGIYELVAHIREKRSGLRVNAWKQDG